MAFCTLVETVAEASGLLELELAGRLVHAGLELLHHRVGVPVEELQQGVHVLVVLLLGDLAHARAGALLDVEEQARSTEPLVLVELVVRAGAQREGAQEQVEGLADGVGVAVGPEVPNPLALAAAHDHRSRPLRVHGDGEERIALVVAQPHVEAGLVALDERVLQHQRLDVVAHLDPLDRLGRLHHRGRPRWQ